MTASGENATLVGRFLIDVVVGEEPDAIDTLLGEDVTDYALVFGDGQGREPVTALGWRVLASAVVGDVVPAGDRVARRGTVARIHRESLVGLAPKVRRLKSPPCRFCRVDNLRILRSGHCPTGSCPTATRRHPRDDPEPIDDYCNRTPVTMTRREEETPDASSSEQTTTTAEVSSEVTDSDGN